MKRLVLGVLLSTGFFAAQACAGDAVPQFGTASMQYLQHFDSRGARPAGTKEEKDAADFIIAELESMGYAPERQAFMETVKKQKATIKVSSENIFCLKEGVSQKEIIVAAHYDSVTAGNGTDDNASGVALLLEMCKSVKDKALPFSVRFVFFGAEELGEVGSKYYVSKMTRADIADTVAVLNYDSLIAGDKLYAHGSHGDKGIVRDWMLKKATSLGIPLVIQTGRNSDYPAGTTGDWGDQAPFEKAGMQYAAFEATNWDLGELDGYTQTDMKLGEEGEIWHTKYDTLSYIERTFPGRAKDHLFSYAKLLYAFLTEYE